MFPAVPVEHTNQQETPAFQEPFPAAQDVTPAFQEAFPAALDVTPALKEAFPAFPAFQAVTPAFQDIPLDDEDIRAGLSPNRLRYVGFIYWTYMPFQYSLPKYTVHYICTVFREVIFKWTVVKDIITFT